MPIGIIFVRDDYFITVSLAKNTIIDSLEKNKNIVTYKKADCFYKYSIQTHSFFNIIKKT